MEDNSIMWLVIAVVAGYYLYTTSAVSTTTTTASSTTPYMAVGPNGVIGTYQGVAATVSGYPLCDVLHGYSNAPCRLV
jgi:hypothetical protein